MREELIVATKMREREGELKRQLFAIALRTQAILRGVFGQDALKSRVDNVALQAGPRSYARTPPIRRDGRFGVVRDTRSRKVAGG